jgi:phosphosulfolactate synthase (CoM biosynthesis protein A)
VLQGPDAVKTYLQEAHDLGFDALELDTGRVVMEPNEELQLVEDVQKVCLMTFLQGLK